METQTTSKGMLWTGRVITILVVLFLVVDFGMKIALAQVSIDGSVALGWPAEKVQLIGFILGIATVLYVIPKTSFIGAILITAYLGGAISIMMRIDTPYWFPLMFGVLVWVGLGLRSAKLREIVLDPLG